MGKFVFAAVFLFALPSLAGPGRLGGFSYNRDRKGRIVEKPATAEFNSYEPQPMPERPHYLNDDGTDARTGVASGGDKYTLIPTYSQQELYDAKAAGGGK
ncbi:MAG: hypothetical protein LBI17_00640 [Rickettsiales bacterium]|jgi:hypothetical protein|nr:hypothetical protein [Rickettsiales bacterium]